MAKFEAASQPAAPRYATRQSYAEPGMTANVVVPAAQAALIAGPVGVVLGIIAGVLDGAATGIMSGVVCALVSFALGFALMRPEPRRWLAEFEEQTGQDVNGDGMIGAPAERQEPRLVFTNKAAPTTTERQYMEQAQLLRLMYAGGPALSKVVGKFYQTTGERVTRGDWERMRDVLLRTRCAHEDAHKSLILDAGLEDTMRTLNVPERFWH
jgi:hypothetical protein